MKEVNISEIKKIIEATPMNINLMLLGDSGVGKTTVVEDYCKENNLNLKTLILSQLDASEALGVPVTKDYADEKGNKIKVMDQAIPNWVIDLSNNKNSVLFLDEFLTAEPSIMNSFLNLLSQKRVGSFDLSHVKIIAASNIGMYTFDPDFNILTRFCFIYVINKSYKRDLPFVYEYEDTNKRVGSIFEPRRLVPRCAESLRYVEPDLLDIFYEGFTNEKPIMQNVSSGIRQSGKVSSIVMQFSSREKNKDGTDNIYIRDELLKALCENLFKEFRSRAYIPVIESIEIFSSEQREKAIAFSEEFKV